MSLKEKVDKFMKTPLTSPKPGDVILVKEPTLPKPWPGMVLEISEANKEEMLVVVFHPSLRHLNVSKSGPITWEPK